jgi:hypothetical protein
MFHTNIKDSQSGMKGFKRQILRQITLWERGFPICSEILVEASNQGLRIAEVGITYRQRTGKSKLKPAVAGPKILLSILNMLRDYDPLFLFTKIGLLLIAIGFFFAWSIISEYIFQGTFRLVGRAMLAVFCWLAGLLSIFTVIILDTINYSIKKIESRLRNQS